MPELPEAILQYWSGLTGLPTLYYQYAPKDAPLPLAVFAPEGFSREYANCNAVWDTYRYRFTILGTAAEAVYSSGFAAVTRMNEFDYNGLIQITPQPEAMATPTNAEAGYQTQWEYSFSIDFLLQPIA